MKKSINFKKFYINIIVIGLLLYAIFELISQQTKLNGYAESQEYYSQKIVEEKKHQTDLKKDRENVNSKEYIEKVAREKLNMFLPNERVYIDISQ